MSTLVNNIRAIRARLASVREGYAVHIPCLSECTARNPIGTAYHCHGCDKGVTPDEVSEKGEAEAFYQQDIAYLLQGIEEMNQRLLRISSAFHRGEAIAEHIEEPF